MKLRLPNKLVAAIMAAASPVLFQTLSTATVGAVCIAVPAFATDYTLTTSDSSAITLSNGDQIIIANEKNSEEIRSLEYSNNITLSGTAKIHSSEWQGRVAVLNGKLAGEGTFEMGAWTGANFCNVYVLTNAESTFTGTLKLTRYSGHNDGVSQLVLNGTGEALKNAVVDLNGTQHILLVQKSATISALKGNGKVESTSADNILTLNVDSDQTFSGTIGSGTYNNWASFNTGDASQKNDTATSMALNLIKNGSAKQTLDGAATLNTVTVNAGTLEFGADSSASTLNMNAGTLTIKSGKTLALGSMQMTDGTINGGGTITVQADSGMRGTLAATTLNVAENATLMLTGQVTFNNNSSITGNGVLKITGPTTGDGFQYYDNDAMETFAGAVVISGCTLQVGDKVTKFENAADLTIADGGIIKGWGQTFTRDITLDNGGLGDAGSNETYSGKITLLSGGGYAYVNSGKTVTVSGVISGTANFEKRGTGTLVLSANNNSTDNTFSGNLTISAGTLKVNNNQALGAFNAADPTSRTITVTQGGTLDINGIGGNDQGQYAVTLAGGKLTNSGGEQGWGSRQLITVLTVENDSEFNVSGNAFGLIGSGYAPTSLTFTNGVLEKTGAGTAYMTNTAISVADGGAGSLKVTQGTLDLRDGSNRTGSLGVDVNMAGGTLASSNGSIHLGKAISITATAVPAVSTGNTNKVTGAISLGEHTLTVGGSETLTLSGNISGTGGLIKNGDNTVMLSGSNTFTGALVVEAGTLKIGSNSSVLGVMDSERAITIESGATLDVNGYEGSGAGYAVTLHGGTLTNSGGSMDTTHRQLVTSLTLTAASTVHGDSGHQFGIVGSQYVQTQINLGSYTLNKTGDATFNIANSTIFGSGSLKASGGYLNFIQGGSLRSNIIMAGGHVTGGINLGAAVTITANAQSTFEASIAMGSNALTVAGAEALTFTNSITGSGTLNVTGNSLTLAGDTNKQFGALNLSNGTLNINSATTVSGAVTSGVDTFINVNKNLTAGSLSVSGEGPHTIRLGNNAVMTAGNSLWLGQQTLNILNTTGSDEPVSGGSLVLNNLLLGVNASLEKATIVNIDKGNIVRITGTAASDNLNNGLVIWNGSAHQLNIEGTLVIEGGIRAQKVQTQSGTTQSSETYNIGEHGTLQLNKGITFVSGDSGVQRMGTINVNGGTLAIGGQTTGSKATEVNLKNGSTVVAVDANTSTEQVFTIADSDATVNFEADAGNELQLNGAFNGNAATASVVIKAGKNATSDSKGVVTLNNRTENLAAVQVEGNAQLKLSQGNALNVSGKTSIAKNGDAAVLEGVTVNAAGITKTEGASSATISHANIAVGSAPAEANLLALAEEVSYNLSDVNLVDTNVASYKQLAVSNVALDAASSINAHNGGTLEGSNRLTLGGMGGGVTQDAVLTSNQLSGLMLTTGSNLTIDLSAHGYAAGATDKSIFSIELSNFSWQDLVSASVDAATYEANTGHSLNDVFKVLALGSTDTYFNVISVAQGVTGGSGITLTLEVPEPATATLSLLALAGLAARRRRK